MTEDITEFVRSCTYCRLSNATTSHEAQSILQAMETQEPFDVIFLDVWMPGDFPAKWGEIKGLTCISSFAEAALIKKQTRKRLQGRHSRHSSCRMDYPSLSS
jgi:CheY-like chemotaxis protein